MRIVTGRFNLLASLLSVLLAGAAPAATSGSQPMPVVVELFTSQGCNSCPPADALLGELARDPGVIALAYHVQYWDRLGWADRFGMPESAARQSRYVGRRLSAGAFTPQLIVNAEHSLEGGNRSQALAVVRELRSQTVAGVAIVATVLHSQLHIALPVRPGMTSATEVLLLPVVSQADSFISRGENSGRSLREFNIVRSIRRLGSWQGAAMQFDVSLNSLPADADRVAVLLQESRQGALRGAVLLSLR